MERTAFLQRIRDRLAHGPHDSLPHPIAHVDGVPRVRYTRDLDDPAAAYIEAAELLGIVVGHDPAELVRHSGAATACFSSDPEVGVVRSLGLREVPAQDAELGVVGAAWAIAATGTAVFDAARAGRRTASLLPPAVLILVRAGNIVATAADVLRSMAERFPEGPPSQLVFASGPSRSGDIELELTTGVHGPGRVYVAILP